MKWVATDRKRLSSKRIILIRGWLSSRLSDLIYWPCKSLACEWLGADHMSGWPTLPVTLPLDICWFVYSEDGPVWGDVSESGCPSGILWTRGAYQSLNLSLSLGGLRKLECCSCSADFLSAFSGACSLWLSMVGRGGDGGGKGCACLGHRKHENLSLCSELFHVSHPILLICRAVISASPLSMSSTDIFLHAHVRLWLWQHHTRQSKSSPYWATCLFCSGWVYNWFHTYAQVCMSSSNNSHGLRQL